MIIKFDTVVNPHYRPRFVALARNEMLDRGARIDEVKSPLQSYQYAAREHFSQIIPYRAFSFLPAERMQQLYPFTKGTGTARIVDVIKYTFC